jgi:phosphate:Na+ symporter
MDIFYRLLALFGGLALFLYGMRIMGDGLKSSSGGAMKAALARVTGNPVMGFILGLIVTCMIQSSHATIVLTVGLVGAGFLTFRQSVGVVLGANVGTAITAQIIRLMDVDAGSGSLFNLFKSQNLASIALVTGIILIMFIKTRRADAIGTICMGFGILFAGLMNMSNAVSAFGQPLSKLLTSFEDNYLLGFLSGVAVTGVIQSSSAVVGILQTIASSVGVRFCGVFAVIIGVNIGDCLTAYLVCRIGAKPDQIRTVLVHVIYNIFAASMLFIAVGILRGTGVISDHLWYMTLNSGGVANVHGLFRLIPALILLPFANKFADMAERIVKDEPVSEEDSIIEHDLRELDERLTASPRIALNQSAHLIGHMADVSMHNYEACLQQIFEYEKGRKKRISEREHLLDRMADASNKYIVRISPHITLEADEREQDFQLKALVAFERIGDLAVNISHYANTMHDEEKNFSDRAQKELRIAAEAVRQTLQRTVTAFKNEDVDLAKMVEPLEEVNDEIIDYLQKAHMDRMTHGECEVFNGIQFQNILQNMERISDQCSDTAVYLLARYDDKINGDEHRYVHDLHHNGNKEYWDEFNRTYNLYFSQFHELVRGDKRAEKIIPKRYSPDTNQPA